VGRARLAPGLPVTSPPCYAGGPFITPWTLCECCEDFWCNIHNAHAYDCSCPSIEVWCDNGTSPYEPQEISIKMTAADQEKFDSGQVGTSSS
jgi:hypothetical protein